MLFSEQFYTKILQWHRQHGRKDLPWQKKITPYRVWVSEIMLQQTQVNTVIPYFEKFIQQFPDITSLARAPEDAVLHLWTGLGYYARARNLHKTAIVITQQHQAVFPNSLETLIKLPGIGRSTAGAILAIGFQQRATILDGNVKRILSRFHAIDTFKNEAMLWQIAEHYTPPALTKKKISQYTQGMMDLGAMICTRTRPCCDRCPVQKNCQAYIYNQQSIFPSKKLKKILPVKKVFLLLLIGPENKILLEKRPSTGIWGGLWSLPQFNALTDIQKIYGYKKNHLSMLAHFRHTFTHFHLDIYPVSVKIKQIPPIHASKNCWYDPLRPVALGLSAPVKKIIDKYLTLLH